MTVVPVCRAGCPRGLSGTGLARPCSPDPAPPSLQGSPTRLLGRATLPMRRDGTDSSSDRDPLGVRRAALLRTSRQGGGGYPLVSGGGHFLFRPRRRRLAGEVAATDQNHGFAPRKAHGKPDLTEWSPEFLSAVMTHPRKCWWPHRSRRRDILLYVICVLVVHMG